MKVRFSLWLRLMIAVCLFSGMGVLSASAEKLPVLLVVSGTQEEPYGLTVKGFKSQMQEADKYQVIEAPLADLKTGAKRIDDLKPAVICALGGDALQWASQTTASIPIVATLVLKESNLKIAPNVTGINLEYSLKTQFLWLKKIFGQQKRVAILYNPGENADAVKSAEQISEQNGFSLVAIPVEKPKELPYALERLTNNIDVLLAIPDEIVMSVNTAKEVLLASFRNKVPLVGLSDNWVKSGAIYALSWDYEDLGRQSALMAQKLLAGAKITTVPPETPRQITYTVNMKIADHMNMEIPADVIKQAKIIFD
jgi:putative tryptophan/tyrosine transport system substrate-binding protein